MRLARICVALILPLLLTGCFLSPGKFTADMVIMHDAGFSFAYRGEIQMLGLSQLIEMGKALDDADDGTFVPSPCYGDAEGLDAGLIDAAFAVYQTVQIASAYAERQCSQSEIAAQRNEWEAQKIEKAEEDARNLEIAKAFLGGIDPTSPQAIEELTARIAKQKGWNSITHKGNGIFDVDYAISGRIDQDYAFPVLERTQGLSPFIIAVARKNGTVRIDAPGFAASQQMGSFGGIFNLFQLIGAAALAENRDTDDNNPFANLPQPDGIFTIRTNGEILTNNTEDGPMTDGDMRILTWKVSARESQPPSAMIGTGAQ